MVKISNFFIHNIKSYLKTNIENVTDGTQIFKILPHMYSLPDIYFYCVDGMERLESFMWIYLLEETSPSFKMGLRFGVASDQLSAQHHSRSNSDFTQH
jgi:hypothetical protein